MLSLEEGRALVRAARTSIESHFSGRKPRPDGATTNLTQPAGVFVTLLSSSPGKSLRGCIGNPFPDRPLLEQATHSAVEAATMDPRFKPVQKDELLQVIIEVTVLAPLERLEVKNPLELPRRIVVGQHGLVVEAQGRKGLLLPQVAVDEGFDSEEFLSQCCLKAGLLPDAWLTGTVKISRFSGQIFSEESPGGPISERRLGTFEK